MKATDKQAGMAIRFIQQWDPAEDLHDFDVWIRDSLDLKLIQCLRGAHGFVEGEEYCLCGSRRRGE